MIDSEDQDQRDPLRAAFESHQRAPHDVVPPHEHSVDALRRLADGTEQVQISHYEITEHGVLKHTEWSTITRPITGDESP